MIFISEGKSIGIFNLWVAVICDPKEWQHMCGLAVKGLNLSHKVIIIHIACTQKMIYLTILAGWRRIIFNAQFLC